MSTSNRKKNSTSRNSHDSNTETRFTTPRIVNSKRIENMHRLSARKTGKVNRVPVKNSFDSGFIVAGILSIITICILVLLVWGLFHKNAQSINIDGEQVAIIKDLNTTTTEFNNLIVAKIKDKAGNNIQINETVTLTPVHASHKNITGTNEHVLTLVCDKLTYKQEASAIMINGREMAVLANATEAQALLDQILALYEPAEPNPNTKIAFVDDVQITPKFVESNEILSTVKAYDILNANTTEQKIYTVKSGDSFSGIASKAEMTETRLLELNPTILPATKHMLKIGQELNIEMPVPVLSIKTIEEVTHTKPIEIPVQTVNNNNEYKTYRKVLSPGKEGTKEVTEQIIYINSVETERIVVNEKIITEPIPQKVDVGTLQTPPKR